MIAPGTTTDAPVIGSDLFPTILGICGVKPPSDRVIDGTDVLSVLTGKAQTVARKVPLYWRLNMAPPKENRTMALREGDWKLLASQDLSHFELYNLKSDPHEQTDLKAAEAERFGALRKTLVQLSAEIEKEGPDWWKRLSPNGGGPVKKNSPSAARAKARSTAPATSTSAASPGSRA